jgi:hypothetical protein
MSKKYKQQELYNRDGYRSYPEEIPVYPTHEAFPTSGKL